MRKARLEKKKPNKMPTIPCGHAKAVMRFFVDLAWIPSFALDSFLVLHNTP